MSSEQLAQTRPGRVLLGWMSPPEAVAALAAQRQRDLDRPEYEERAANARRAAQERRPSFGLDGVVDDPPPALRALQAKLAEDETIAAMFAAGTRLALVDLRRVCALQARVVLDDAVRDFDPEDLEALLAFSVRPPNLPRLEVQYDSSRKAWIILAPDFNLRITREFRTELEGGATGLGFEVRQFGTSIRVVRHRDRYLLIDGYHRAVALLGRGVDVVPALVDDEVPTRDLLAGAAGIRPELFLGDRPPLLPDFWDDEVAAEVPIPSITRVLVVEALDLRAWGAGAAQP